MSANLKVIAKQALESILGIEAGEESESPSITIFVPQLDRDSSTRIIINASSKLFSSTQTYYASAPLLYQTLKATTNKAYDRALECFAKSLGSSSISFEILDSSLAEYSAEEINGNASAENIQKVVNTLAALVHRLSHLKSDFPITRLMLRGWNKTPILKQAGPITRRFRDLIVIHLLDSGEVDMAACISVAWAALLRIREAISLEAGDIALSGDPILAKAKPNAYGIFVRQAKKLCPSQLMVSRNRLALYPINKCLKRQRKG